MIYVKIHKGPSTVVAICDENLIGKKFKEGKLVLKVSEHFFKGEKMSKEEVVKLLKNADNLDIVGKECVELAVEIGVIKKESVIEIEGVPHAQAISC